MLYRLHDNLARSQRALVPVAERGFSSDRKSGGRQCAHYRFECSFSAAIIRINQWGRSDGGGAGTGESQRIRARYLMGIVHGTPAGTHFSSFSAITPLKKW